MPAKNLIITNVGNVGAKPTPRVNKHPRVKESNVYNPITLKEIKARSD